MAKKGGNPQNLISIGDRTEEEKRAITSAGGKAAAPVIRINKIMAKIVDDLGKQAPKADLETKFAKAYPDIDVEKITNDAVLIAAQYEKAFLGDTKAAEFLRDTSGQKPDNVNQHKGLENMSAEITIINQPVSANANPEDECE